MSIKCGILSCCQAEVKQPPMRIWRKPWHVSSLVKHRDGVNMLCSNNTAQPPHTHTPPPLSYPNIPPLFQSWVNLQRRELGPDFSAVEEPEGPWDTQVTNVESCSISRAQWNNSLPSGTYVKAILDLQHSITLTSIKCFFVLYFYSLLPFPLEFSVSCSNVCPNPLCQIQNDG